MPQNHYICSKGIKIIKPIKPFLKLKVNIFCGRAKEKLQFLTFKNVRQVEKWWMKREKKNQLYSSSSNTYLGIY